MWLKKSNTGDKKEAPSVMVGSYINVGDGLLTVYINEKPYQYYINPSQKRKFESLLKYNRGRALAYLREVEKSGSR